MTPGGFGVKSNSMTQINFYHLTSSPLGKALPKLLEKVLASNLRALVVATSDERVEQLNKELWTYTTKVFLPHGAREDGFAEQQPIYLTAANENPNGATVLALVDDARIKGLEGFEKCLYLFDGNDPVQLSGARARWKSFKEAGHTVTYWKQTAKGGWEQGAT